MNTSKSFSIGGVLIVLSILACSNTTSKKTSENILNSLTNTSKEPSAAFKNYWYAGEAEITSYTLEQARYGEIRSGHAVLIYVTEDFLPDAQVKADQQAASNIPVLKLNSTKKFNTGIYPYSIMQSTFYPVADDRHAIKVSSSMQEWCGHVYAQLNNRKQFEITSHSYFQGEADQSFMLDKTILENELWAKIRINPTALPTGKLDLIPSMEFCRLKHVKIKGYNATATMTSDKTVSVYEISYLDINRSLKIMFNTKFPHEIQGWEERFKSGFGINAKQLTTKATIKKTLKSPYWNKNNNKDEVLREALQL